MKIKKSAFRLHYIQGFMMGPKSEGGNPPPSSKNSKIWGGIFISKKFSPAAGYFLVYIYIYIYIEHIPVYRYGKIAKLNNVYL